ncbi:RAMP superfamily CRISPR-associated protein [Vibrio penaeicida]|uniref:RAMP superfamily CRISPR-associated protein n=1 Tax=Vibrio penaeicida TaxID=104609 RepID=UPI00273682B1|nr:RAMP superfamily CRISPR-associated protein [Vibrio penaeicida]MDP2574211.1 RAMP superfamily CRISPR-associated protein [Vibrio penaeicida]
MTELHSYKCKLTLILRAPFITKTTGAIAFGLDTETLTHNGQMVIPGRLVKGNIRDKVSRFYSALKEAQLPLAPELKSLTDKLFGKEGDEGNLKETALLTFPWRFIETSNSETQTQSHIAWEDTQRFRIKINESTQAVEKGHLQIIESKYATGQSITFEGEIWLNNATETDRINAEKWLNKACEQLTEGALGAFKTVGFGQVQSATLTPFAKHQARQNQNCHLPAFDANENTFPIRLKFDHPICFPSKKSKLDNHLESSSKLAGNIIKAGFANAKKHLKNSVQLNEHFDNVVFRHAKPVSPSMHNRPKQRPLSLAKINDNREPIFVNLATLTKPSLFKNAEGAFVAPTFSTDWKYSDWNSPAKSSEIEKDKEKLVKLFELGDHFPTSTYSVHTAIDEKTGAAKESNLYSMTVIEVDNTEWLSEVVLPNGLSPKIKQEIYTSIQDILAYGIPEMGKTKARMTGIVEAPIASSLFTSKNETKEINLCEESLISIKLESDALLFSTQSLQTQQNLHPLYSDYFDNAVNKQNEGNNGNKQNEVSGESTGLELIVFYASQTLGGGDYYYHRFSKDLAKTQGIEQYINYLTSAGSVFTFKVINAEKAKQTLEHWKAYGLPLPKDLQSLTFNHTPYLPQNGFGEISVMTSMQAPDLKKQNKMVIKSINTAGGNHE